MKNIFYFLFYIIKILTNQNVKTMTKFLSSLIKNIKHFNKKKNLKLGKVTYP